MLGRHGVRSTNWEPYWRLLEAQNFRCWYTGEVLIPGQNASIDHRVPTSRGGKPLALDNLVWCTWDINRTKGALTDVEFVDLCRRVLHHHG
jgi:5-methylcytosine-specific restriction endonuclease McrA